MTFKEEVLEKLLPFLAYMEIKLVSPEEEDYKKWEEVSHLALGEADFINRRIFVREPIDIGCDTEYYDTEWACTFLHELGHMMIHIKNAQDEKNLLSAECEMAADIEAKWICDLFDIEIPDMYDESALSNLEVHDDFGVANFFPVYTTSLERLKSSYDPELLYQKNKEVDIIQFEDLIYDQRSETVILPEDYHIDK
jgi:hypothetical protein